MGVILCGNVDEVKAAAKNGGFNIDGAEILDHATYPEMDALVAQMFELRKGKMRNFSGGTVAKTLPCQCRGPGFDPRPGS